MFITSAPRRLPAISKLGLGAGGVLEEHVDLGEAAQGVAAAGGHVMVGEVEDRGDLARGQALDPEEVLGGDAGHGRPPDGRMRGMHGPCTSHARPMRMGRAVRVCPAQRRPARPRRLPAGAGGPTPSGHDGRDDGRGRDEPGGGRGRRSSGWWSAAPTRRSARLPWTGARCRTGPPRSRAPTPPRGSPPRRVPGIGSVAADEAPPPCAAPGAPPGPAGGGERPGRRGRRGGARRRGRGRPGRAAGPRSMPTRTASCAGARGAWCSRTARRARR